MGSDPKVVTLSLEGGSQNQFISIGLNNSAYKGFLFPQSFPFL